MKLIYENFMGRVTFSGSGDGTFRITALTGLSLPETEADTVRYPDEPGQAVSRISVLPRTITVSGDVWDRQGTAVGRAIGVFAHIGTLTVVTRRFRRRAPCRCTVFLPEERQGGYLRYTLQLVCDDPYFEDTSLQKFVVASRTPLLKTTFTLPAVLSERSNTARVINRGSVNTMPAFTITAPAAATFPKGLVLENRTTGKRLTLYLTMDAGETLTVDCAARKIYTTKQANLLGSLAADCVMSAFFLMPGMNELAVTAEDEPAGITAECTFRNRYGEAMA